MRKALYIIIAVALLGTAAAALQNTGNSVASSSTSGQTTSVSSPAKSSSTSSQANTATPTTQATTPTTSTDTSPASSASSSSSLKDGTYQGTDAVNRFGDVQVSVTISEGKITAVSFDQLDANDSHSAQINNYASPTLVSQTISAQSADITGVSGATYTTNSYITSLQAAIDKAQS